MTTPMPIQEHQRVPPKPRTKRKETRKRSPKACLSCRSRKVRCDVAFVPNSCTNCVLDGKQCVVSWRQRRVCNEECNTTDVETGSKSRHSIPKDDGDSTTTLAKDYYDTPNVAEQCARQPLSHDYIEPQTQPKLTSTYHPFFCISNLGSLHPNDRNYLESQGCTRVPETRCLNELLLGFFRHAHPILPVINEAEFWSAYESPVAGSIAVRVPLVLLSAILFVACNYVEDHVIQSMDFATSRKAAEDFRRKTKLLYDYETECSPLVLAQVSLLLAHWTPQRLGGKGTHWLGRAINHAHDAFAESKLWSFSEKCSSLSSLRRVWRGCVLSDRIHSLYTRRPLAIPVEQAEKGDHGLMLLRADLSHEIGRSRVYGAKVQQRCIEAQERMSDLCTILGRVLTLAYPSTEGSALGGVPMSRELEIEFRECKKDLKTWYTHVSSQFADMGGQAIMLGSRIGSDDGREDATPHNEPVGLLLSMMYLNYDSAILALSHCEMTWLTTAAPTASSHHSLRKDFSLRGVKKTLLDHVHDLTNRLSSCLQSQHLHKLPNIMIFGTALPLLLHHIGTHKQPNRGEGPCNAGLLKHSLSTVDIQHLRDSDDMQLVIDCLRLRFRPELEYLLQAIEAITKSVSQDFEDIAADPSQPGYGEHEFQPGKGSLRLHDWCEVLDTRPELYIHVINTFDKTVSCGGSLPRADSLCSTSGRYEPPRYDGGHKSQPDKGNLRFSPIFSPATSQINTAEHTSLPLISADGSIKYLDSCLQDGDLPSSADLAANFDNILSQEMRSLESDTTEATDEFPSPRSSETSWGVLSNDFVDIGKVVQETTRTYDSDNGTKPDCQKMHEFTMGNGLDDSWMEAVLEDAVMLEDDMPKEADHTCDDPCVTS